MEADDSNSKLLSDGYHRGQLEWGMGALMEELHFYWEYHQEENDSVLNAERFLCWWWITVYSAHRPHTNWISQMGHVCASCFKTGWQVIEDFSLFLFKRNGTEKSWGSAWNLFSSHWNLDWDTGLKGVPKRGGWMGCILHLSRDH